jgi:hypothetical protein
MKTLLALTLGLFIALPAVAQTTNTLTKIGAGIAALGSSTNWGFVGYGTLGHKTKLGTAYGGGILGIYSINDFMGLGGGIDELSGLDRKGQTTIISANLQAQLPTHPLSMFWTNSFAENFTFTPFLYSGVGTPFGASINQSAVVHEGEGVNLDLFKTGTWEIGLGFALIQRQNAGIYSGGYKNILVAIHHPF